MEESSEQRRERLRALRERAFAGNDGVEEPETNTSSLPSFFFEDSPTPQSSVSRFDFYTDPIIAYTGSQNKKTKLSNNPIQPVTSNIHDNTYSASNIEYTYSPAAGHGFGTGETVSCDPQFVHASNLNNNISMSREGSHHQNQNHRSYGNFPNPNSNYDPNRIQDFRNYPNVRPNFDHNRSQNVGIPDQYRNPNTNHTEGRFHPHNSGFRSSQQYSNSGFRPQGYSQRGRGGRAFNGGRGFQQFQQNRGRGAPSAVTNPERFAKSSMLMDPWKYLKPVPICIEQSSDSKDWLPGSIKENNAPVTEKGPSIQGSGPSLFDCLSASVDDAVQSDVNAS